MMNIKIKISDLEINCTVKNTQTGKKIYSMLPVKNKINTWGKEIYFSLPKNNIMSEKDAKEVFKLGEIAFWNQGNAIAIGFGPTPASLGSEIRLISKANHWANAKKPYILRKLDHYKSGMNIDVLRV